jgi:hypothetical protein
MGLLITFQNSYHHLQAMHQRRLKLISTVESTTKDLEKARTRSRFLLSLFRPRLLHPSRRPQPSQQRSVDQTSVWVMVQVGEKQALFDDSEKRLKECTELASKEVVSRLRVLSTHPCRCCLPATSASSPSRITSFATQSFKHSLLESHIMHCRSS